MAGLSSTIGALPQEGQSTADINAAQNPMTQGPSAAVAPVANNAGLQRGANFGYALGDLYGDYKKAQLDQVTQNAQLASASRARLNQIWEAGQLNPQIQNDPKTHAEIAKLWKGMTGADFPVTPGQQFSWDTIAPTKSINDLSPQMLQALREAQPKDRAVMAKAWHIVDADQAFLNAPALISPARLAVFQKEYTDIVLNGNHKGLGPAGFQSWVDTNRPAFDQAFGEGAADKILNDPQIFHDLQITSTAQLKKMQEQIADLQGITPEAKARIAKDYATARDANSLSDLNNIKTKIGKVQLQDLPGIDTARISQMNANAGLASERVALVQQQAANLIATGSGTDIGQVTKQYAQAVADYRVASAAYASASNSGMGIPDEIQQAYDNALVNKDALQAVVQTLTSPDTQKKIAVAKANAVSNLGVKPTTGGGANPNFVWKATMHYKGQDIGPNADGTKWVNAKGEVVQ